MSWIKVRTLLKDDGRLLIISRKCNASTVTVLGGLVTLWCYADTLADENGVLFGWKSEDINARIGIPNFAESLPTDWIDLSGEWVQLPNYAEHNGSTGKTRALTNKRVSRLRNASTVTKSLPEKIREEKNIKDKNIKPPTPLKVSSVDDVILPEHWNNELGRDLMQNWIEDKKARGEKYTQRGFQALISKNQEWTIQELEIAVKESLANQWKGLFLPKNIKTTTSKYNQLYNQFKGQ